MIMMQGLKRPWRIWKARTKASLRDSGVHQGFFTGDSGDGGIINDTKDDILGADAVIDSTLDAINSADRRKGKLGTKS